MLKPASQSQPLLASRLPTGLGHAYATLGLRAREARTDTIRSAAQKTSRDIRRCTVNTDEQVQLIAEVATCTYRLLDPRRRLRQIERIQLVIQSERAQELQGQSRRSLLASHLARRSLLQSA